MPWLISPTPIPPRRPTPVDGERDEATGSHGPGRGSRAGLFLCFLPWLSGAPRFPCPPRYSPLQTTIGHHALIRHYPLVFFLEGILRPRFCPLRCCAPLVDRYCDYNRRLDISSQFKQELAEYSLKNCPIWRYNPKVAPAVSPKPDQQAFHCVAWGNGSVVRGMLPKAAGARKRQTSALTQQYRKWLMIELNLPSSPQTNPCTTRCTDTGVSGGCLCC